MPSTARTVPREVSNRTCRSCTSSRGAFAPSRDRLSDKVPPTLDSSTRTLSSVVIEIRYTRSVGERPPNPSLSHRRNGRGGSGLADLAQDFRGVLTEARGGALGRHRPAADDDRRAHARDRSGLGGRARWVDLHTSVEHLWIGEDLIERVDRPSRNLHGF